MINSFITSYNASNINLYFLNSYYNWKKSEKIGKPKKCSTLPANIHHFGLSVSRWFRSTLARSQPATAQRPCQFCPYWAWTTKWAWSKLRSSLLGRFCLPRQKKLSSSQWRRFLPNPSDAKSSKVRSCSQRPKDSARWTQWRRFPRYAIGTKSSSTFLRPRRPEEKLTVFFKMFCTIGTDS